jgi:hypothetical protein
MRYAMIICLFAAIVPGFAKSLKSKDIPAQVISTFKTACPKAEDVRWEMKSDNFEVNYECNDADMSLVINPNGTILEKATEIRKTALPAGTTETLTAKYPGFIIRESEKVERNGTTEYEVDLVKKIEVIVGAAGNLIKETNEKEDDIGENGHGDDDHGEHDDDD